MRTKMHNISWTFIVDYCVCGLFGFGLRFVKDRKKEPRPDWIYSLVASIALTYLACFSWYFYSIKWVPAEIWISVLSFNGGFIVSTIDYVSKNGLLIYLRKIAEEFLAYTKKDK